MWGPFPKDAQFQRRLRPLGRPRFALLAVGGQENPREPWRGLRAGLVSAGAWRLEVSRSCSRGLAGSAGHRGMGWMSRQELRHLQCVLGP